MNVPFLPKRAIVACTHEVLLRHQSNIGKEFRPPIPVEAIIEQTLELQLAFLDFEQEFKMHDVMGATFVEQRLISANTNLLSSGSEGRLCFTLAHEIAHWELHRRYVKNKTDSDTIFCRSNEGRRPIEWQADYFAACLLMPEQHLRETWRAVIGDEAIIFHSVKKCIDGPFYVEPCLENWPIIVSTFSKAAGFDNVSKQAMFIRLQEVGLIRNETGQRYVPRKWID